MNIKLEQFLHFGAAAINLATAFGLDPAIAMLLMAAISVGLAVAAQTPCQGGGSSQAP